VKSLIPAAILALLLHGLFLVVPPEWRPRNSKPLLQPRPVTMTLSYCAPAKPAAPPVKIPLTPRKAPTPAPPRQLKKETKPPTPKTRPKIRKPEKKKAQPLPTPKKSLPPWPPPRPAVAPEKEASRKPEARTDKPFTRGTEAFSPRTTPRGQGLQGGHKKATDPAPPPLVDAIPVYRENPTPRYPRMAKRRGYEGTVLLEVLVNREGKVKELRIFHSSGYPVLDKAALSAVKKWVFESGKRGDESIEMWVKIPVRFQLK
jgi:protein TonB